MNTRFVSGLLLAALLSPAAHAVPVTWNFSGSLGYVENAGPDDEVPPYIVPGAPYSLTLTFDTARFGASPANPCALSPEAGGCISAYGSNQPDALRFSLDFGGNDCKSDAGIQPCSPDYGPSELRAGIFIYNDLASPIPFVDPIDGVRFTLFPGSEGSPGTGTRWAFGLISRTNLFSSMPTLDSLASLDPATLSFHVFEFCEDASNPHIACNRDAVWIYGEGPSETVPVPAPGTLGLLGVALAGMGLARRWRARG